MTSNSATSCGLPDSFKHPTIRNIPAAAICETHSRTFTIFAIEPEPEADCVPSVNTCAIPLPLLSSSIISRINRAHPALLVIFNRLADFRLRVHHKRAVTRDWFVQGHSGDEQHFERSLRVRRIFDSHFLAVLREQNHLPVFSAFAFCSEQSLGLHDVSEGVVSARHPLGGHASGLDSVMQVYDRRARLNHS